MATDAEDPVETCATCKDPEEYIRQRVCSVIADGREEECVHDFLPVLEARKRKEIDGDEMRRRFRDLFTKYAPPVPELGAPTPISTTTSTTKEGPALFPRVRLLDMVDRHLASRLGQE